VSALGSISSLDLSDGSGCTEYTRTRSAYVRRHTADVCEPARSFEKPRASIAGVLGFNEARGLDRSDTRRHARFKSRPIRKLSRDDSVARVSPLAEARSKTNQLKCRVEAMHGPSVDWT